jgi:hypothetical protein
MIVLKAWFGGQLEIAVPCTRLNSCAVVSHGTPSAKGDCRLRQGVSDLRVVDALTSLTLCYHLRGRGIAFERPLHDLGRSLVRMVRLVALLSLGPCNHLRVGTWLLERSSHDSGFVMWRG